MSDTSSSSSGGVSIVGLLGVAFVVLKLCGVIDWPWLWVLAPFWIGFVVVGVILLIVLIVWLVVRRREGASVKVQRYGRRYTR